MPTQKKQTIALLASTPLKLLLKLRHGRRIQFGKKVILNTRFKFTGPGTLRIGDHSTLWAHAEKNEFHTYDPNATIEIGAHSRLNGANIQCKTQVIIGEKSIIGSALITDTDHHSTNPDHRNNPDYIKSAPITIRENCWIAGQSAILKGVEIGHNSTIGFRSVVTKNIPSNSIAVGNPAKVIKTID